MVNATPALTGAAAISFAPMDASPKDMRMTRYFRTVASLMGTSALALTLSACKLDNRPLLGRDDARASYDAAPPLGPLDPGSSPAAAYLPPVQAYAYPERAYAVSRAAYPRPPSYAFDYGDVQPWAWEAADDGLMFAEPYGDDWRYYYYEPGEDYPYYVQDPDYGYAFGDGGVLLALFTAAGALIAADRYDDYAPRAGYYWTHAHDLNRSYWGSPRYRIDEAVWRARAPIVFASHDRWHRAFESQPAWREAARHDNGRHLGWYKDRDDRGWTAARQAAHARAQHDFRREERREDRRPKAAEEVRQERGPQRAEHVAPAQGRGRDDGGGALREARQERGPQPQARHAGSHGREAGWKGQDRPQAQQGGGHGQSRGGDGGRDDRHGGDGGGDDKGGGHGKGGRQ